MASRLVRRSKEGGSKRRKGNKSNMSRVSPKAMFEVGGGNVQLTKFDNKPMTAAVISPQNHPQQQHRPDTSYLPLHIPTALPMANR
jgi:hypothetical protein